MGCNPAAGFRSYCQQEWPRLRAFGAEVSPLPQKTRWELFWSAVIRVLPDERGTTFLGHIKAASRGIPLAVRTPTRGEILHKPVRSAVYAESESCFTE